MARDSDAITRRDFLKAGGAGLAIMASRPIGSQAAGAPARQKPIQPVILDSGSVQLTLDRRDALPYEYLLPHGNVRFRGEDAGVPINAIICERSSWNFFDMPLTANAVAAMRNQAEFRFDVRQGDKPAATFTLRYVLDDATVHITLENVIEAEGYELIQVEMPRLVSLGESDGPAWLAHGDSGGSLALVKEATPGRLKPNAFWGGVLASLPVVMLGTDRALCVQEVTAYMDETTLLVDGEEGNRRASLGTNKVHRVNGGLSYDMNTGQGTPRIFGNKETPNLLVGQKSSCRLDFIVKDGRPVDWLDGAKAIRRRMPPRATHYYDDKLIYGIHCDEPKYEKPLATFEQCEKLIESVAALTDRSPQIVHLWGWQYRGKDTGYPAVAEVNHRVGTHQGLMQLMESGRRSNCAVTFSDNYDDAYKSSPAWEPKFIARRPDGELWESRNWTGENSYIIGLAKYMNGPGKERVRYTCEHYRLRETAHVDVLSYFSIRNDWDRASPASGIKNLFEGRYKVLEEFSKYGVDVSSEALRYAFIGKISCFWHMPAPAPCPFGGQPIPLLPAIYRRSALWGEAGRSHSLGERILNMLFYNMCPHPSLGSDSAARDVTDLFYLVTLPWFKLHSRNIESFRRDGTRAVMGLEGDSRVEMDWSSKLYKVVVDGIEIASNESTYCPLDGARIAFYSTTQKELAAPLPKGWSTSTLRARALAKDGAKPAQVEIRGQAITVIVPPCQPIIVDRGADSGRDS